MIAQKTYRTILAILATSIAGCTFMLMSLQKQGFQQKIIPRYSSHHIKVLNSVKDWNQFGFFQLGGLMSFRKEINEPITKPEAVYRSHAPWYALPHWAGFATGGTKGFYLTVTLLTFFLALTTSICTGLIAYSLFSSTATSTLSATASAIFASLISTTGEAVWATGFYNFDCTVAFQALLIGATISAFNPKPKTNKSKKIFDSLYFIFILSLPALIAPRTGFAVTITLLLTKIGIRKKTNKQLPRAIELCTSYKAIAWTSFLTILHPLRIAIFSNLSGGMLSISGSDITKKMGIVPTINSLGQGDLDFSSTFHTFGFLWRQSEYIDSGFPIILDVEHFIFWTTGILLSIALLANTHKAKGRFALILLIIPPIILHTIFNQSAAEHPDYYNYFWQAPLVLGTTYWAKLAIEKMPRSSIALAPIIWAIIGIWITLGQIRYFLLAYPF